MFPGPGRKVGGSQNPPQQGGLLNRRLPGFGDVPVRGPNPLGGTMQTPAPAPTAAQPVNVAGVPLQQQFGRNEMFNLNWPQNRIADPNNVLQQIWQRNPGQVANWLGQERDIYDQPTNIMGPIGAADYQAMPDETTAGMVFARMNGQLPINPPPQFPAYNAPRRALQYPGAQHYPGPNPPPPFLNGEPNSGHMQVGGQNVMNLQREIGRNPNQYEMVGLFERTMGLNRNDALRLINDLGLDFNPQAAVQVQPFNNDFDASASANFG